MLDNTRVILGMRLNAPKYSGWARKVFEETVLHRRQLVELPAYTEKGVRFKDNTCVLLRLESNFTEAEFMLCPGRTVDMMLVDAAQSDYWYNHEKDYGGEDDTCETECEVDE